MDIALHNGQEPAIEGPHPMSLWILMTSRIAGAKPDEPARSFRLNRHLVARDGNHISFSIMNADGNKTQVPTVGPNGLTIGRKSNLRDRARRLDFLDGHHLS